MLVFRPRKPLIRLINNTGFLSADIAPLLAAIVLF